MFEEGRAGTLSHSRLTVEVYMMIRAMNISDDLKNEILSMIMSSLEYHISVTTLQEGDALLAALEEELGVAIPRTREQQVEAIRRVLRRVREVLEREEREGGA